MPLRSCLPFLSAGNGDHPQQGMGRKAFGAISIYSKEPDPFSEDEVRLLSELAHDLAYGISAIRMKAARRRAEEALRRNEAEARAQSRRARNHDEYRPRHSSICPVILSAVRWSATKYGYDFLKMPPGSNISATAPSEDRPTHLTSRKDGVLIPPEEMPMQIAARTGVPQYDYEYDVVFENGAILPPVWECGPHHLMSKAGILPAPSGSLSISPSEPEQKRKRAAWAQNWRSGTACWSSASRNGCRSPATCTMARFKS